MSRNEDSMLQQNIRRAMSSPMTTRFARSLPFFRTSEALPAQLHDLLDRLEAQEAATVNQGGRH